MCCFDYKKLLQRVWMFFKPFFLQNYLGPIRKKLAAALDEKLAGMMRSRMNRK
jgi:hypothetical protein